MIGAIPSFIWRPRLERPLFVVGCPRSGTTLLAGLLGLHPDLANLSEGEWIWDPEGFDDPEADHVWSADDATAQRIDVLHRRFEFFRRLEGRPRLLNKRPRSSVRLPFIHRAFPDARIVHVHRDGRAVLRSLLARVEKDPGRRAIPYGGFCKPPDWRARRDGSLEESFAHLWVELVTTIRRHAPLFGERFFELSYAALCRDPRRMLRRIWAFAGLDPEPPPLATVPPFFEDRSRHVFAEWTPERLAAATEIQRDLLVELGYLKDGRDGEGS